MAASSSAGPASTTGPEWLRDQALRLRDRATTEPPSIDTAMQDLQQVRFVSARPAGFVPERHIRYVRGRPVVVPRGMHGTRFCGADGNDCVRRPHPVPTAGWCRRLMFVHCPRGRTPRWSTSGDRFRPEGSKRPSPGSHTVVVYEESVSQGPIFCTPRPCMGQDPGTWNPPASTGRRRLTTEVLGHGGSVQTSAFHCVSAQRGSLALSLPPGKRSVRFRSRRSLPSISVACLPGVGH